MTTTQTYVLGRYRLEMAVGPTGRIRETWSPRPPCRLTPAELQGYHQARRAFVAPLVIATHAGDAPSLAQSVS